jgi:hypothetical protein
MEATMKQLLIWCAVFWGLYGGMSAAYHVHLTRHPRRVLVAVDTSFPMQVVWSQVPDTLAALRTQRYTLFSLITDKTHIHTWQPQLDLGHLQPYAPRALAQMLDQRRYPDIVVADQVYVVTNAANSTALAKDKRWHIVQLQPMAP